jgi:hypothetical protein
MRRRRSPRFFPVSLRGAVITAIDSVEVPEQSASNGHPTMQELRVFGPWPEEDKPWRIPG